MILDTHANRFIARRLTDCKFTQILRSCSPEGMLVSPVCLYVLNSYSPITIHAVEIDLINFINYFVKNEIKKLKLLKINLHKRQLFLHKYAKQRYNTK
jgi:hypothetical protein